MTAGNYSAPRPIAFALPEVELVIPESCVGVRLDAALARLLPEHSRSRIRSWIDSERVSIGGIYPEGSRKLSGGERVLVRPLLDPREAPFVAQALPLAVVHDDASIAVIDKPAGLVVHPGSGNWDGTLANALLHRWPQLESVPRAGIVHRLDKDTSGLLVVAKTLIAQTHLVRQLQAHSVRRHYLALASGDLDGAGVIEAPIGRHPVRRIAMAVVTNGKPAITRWRSRERFGACTLLECRLETGRTHQIRVHLASIGHSLVGDPVYGKKQAMAFHRQALHAATLALVHPETQATVQFESALPQDFAALLDALRATAA